LAGVTRLSESADSVITNKVLQLFEMPAMILVSTQSQDVDVNVSERWAAARKTAKRKPGKTIENKQNREMSDSVLIMISMT
jgi:hypothetical protein